MKLKILDIDPYLAPYRSALEERVSLYPKARPRKAPPSF